MTITTEYNIGDAVFTVNTDTLKIIEGKVEAINIWVSKTPDITYSISDGEKTRIAPQDKCFRTSEQLLRHLTGK